VYDERDRREHDPRDGLMHDLDLPRGDAREVVVDRNQVYELNGEDSRALSTTPQQRTHPDFPVRAFVRCESCGRGLTGSWSKGLRYCSKCRFAKARPEPDFR